MKKFFLAAAILGTAAFSTSAMAADPIAPATYDWTGAYLGLNAGYAFGGGNDVDLVASNGNVFDDLANLDLSGITGGLQAGYNWQSDSFVLGAEADLQIADIGDEEDFSVLAPAALDGSASTDIDFWGTARLRAGWAADRILIYATGGLAWANVDHDIFAVDGVGNNVSSSSDNIELGWTVGGGAEFAINDSMTVRAEYLYIDLGNQQLDGTVLTAGGVPNGVTTETDMSADFHVARLALNWRF